MLSTILIILIIICLFSVSAIFNQCADKTLDDEEKSDVETTEEDIEITEESEEETNEEATEDIEESEQEATERDQKEEKEAPTIKLEIYEGPVFSSVDNVCYYRVRANVNGVPTPDVEFSKDDSGGAWGEYKVQVNLNDPSDTYTLSATAFNSEGTATSTLILKWGCDEQKAGEEKTYTHSEQELEYFFETVLGVEFGSSQPVIHKWTDNIRIKVNGAPTSEDLDVLNLVVTELNSLIGSISLDIVTLNPNVEIYFTTVDQFTSIEPNYVPGNMGFLWIWWDFNGVIYKGNILISLDGISQQERSHLIREELTQSIGIMKDSNRYKDSIFYQGWTDTLTYAPIDRTIISLLYDARLKPGMTQDKVRSVLNSPGY